MTDAALAGSLRALSGTLRRQLAETGRRDTPLGTVESALLKGYVERFLTAHDDPTLRAAVAGLPTRPALGDAVFVLELLNASVDSRPGATAAPQEAGHRPSAVRDAGSLRGSSPADDAARREGVRRVLVVLKQLDVRAATGTRAASEARESPAAQQAPGSVTGPGVPGRDGRAERANREPDSPTDRTAAGAGVQAGETLSLQEADVGRLAALFLRSYLILTGQARGSRPQAQAFDDWLESYRAKSAEAVVVRAAQHPGCPEAEIAIPDGKVMWWEIPDADIRFLCAYALTSGYEIPRDADPVPLIRAFILPPRPDARILSVKGATPADRPQTTPRLAGLRGKLRDENIMTRLDAVTALEKDGAADALPGLKEAMRNDHIAVRIQAAYALGRVTEAIAARWGDTFRAGPIEAQIETVREMDRLGVLHAAAVPELVETVLTDRHMAAIVIAATGLCIIGQKAAMASLLSIDALRAAPSSGLIAEVNRLNAAGVAGILGLEAALACTIDTVRQDVKSTLTPLARFRGQLRQAAWALHSKLAGQGDTPPETDPAEVARTVDKLLSSDSGGRRSASALLLSMRDPAVVAPHVRRIAGLLKDPDPGVREDVALTLGALGRFAALGVLGLRAALADPQPAVRTEAARALEKIGPAAGLSVPALISMGKEDGSPEVREAAREAVARIGRTFA